MESRLAANLGEQLKCSICLKQYKEPKVLSCLHSFCKKCLSSVVTKKGEKYVITCPHCRQETEIVNGDISRLQSNFLINNLLSLVAVHGGKIREASNLLLCETCESKEKATSRCSDCCQFLCEFCEQAHRRLRASKNHRLMTMAEVKAKGARGVVKPSFCVPHPKEELKLFCKTCDLTICRDCTVVEHRDHDYLFITDAYERQEREIITALQKVKSKLPALKSSEATVKEMERRVEIRSMAINQEIDNFFDSHIKALKDKRISVKQDLLSLKQAKLKQLGMQRESISFYLGCVNSSIEFTERALQAGTAVDVLSVKNKMVNRLLELNALDWEREPCQDDVMQFKHSTAIGGAISNIGSVDEVQAKADQCLLSMNNGQQGNMYTTLRGQRREFIVHARDRHGQNRKDGGDDIEVTIKVPPDYKRWIQIPIEDAGDGTYNFCYTPEVEGKYHIAVRVGAEYTSKYAIVWEITNWSLGQKVPQFTAGKYSWKVKLQKEAGETQIGVTAKRQFWVWKSGEKLEGTPFHAKSAISEWKAGDEFVVFLDCECERLTVVNTRNGQCDVWNGLRQGVYSPYCYPTDNVSLDI